MFIKTISATIAAAVAIAAPIRAAPIDQSQVVAVAKVLAGGEIGEPAGTDKLDKGVFSRLLARGAVAQKECGLKNQMALAMWVGKELGLVLYDDDDEGLNMLRFASVFAGDDFRTLGKKEWCTDYVARATPASALFASFMKTGKKGKAN